MPGREAELKEGQLLCNYLPLLREVLPDVAAEVEAHTAQLAVEDDGEESTSNSSMTSSFHLILSHDPLLLGVHAQIQFVFTVPFADHNYKALCVLFVSRRYSHVVRIIVS